MINAIDNGLLLTDLDAALFDIMNVGSLLPVPTNLVATDDSRLTDSRTPAVGSVTNASVSATAAIVQSKLSLNGQIPPSWLGTTATTAAQGNLAEYLANKGIAGGYAGLDGTGKVPAEQLPDDAGTGTVTSVALSVVGHLTVTGSPVETSGTITATWDEILGPRWFGNTSGASATPIFTDAPFSVSLVPLLPASKVVSGVFDPSLVPIAVGVGGSAAPGAVPDPGATGDPTDYLARDMTYQSLPTIGAAYQPKVPDPTLTPGYPAYEGTQYAVQESLAGVSLFYSIASGTYEELPSSGYVIVPTGQTLDVYGAKSGYTNSNIISVTAP